MNKMKAAVGGFAVAIMLGAMLPTPNAYARRHKVDCSKVMEELNSGKKVSEVAKDLHISRSSVRRCKKAAAAEGGAEASPGGAMASPGGEMSPGGATASPGGMASPAH